MSLKVVCSIVSHLHILKRTRTPSNDDRREGRERVVQNEPVIPGALFAQFAAL